MQPTNARNLGTPPERIRKAAQTSLTAMWQAFAIFAVVLLVYSPSFYCGFMWDDAIHITSNRVTRPYGLYRAWVGQDQPNYWPVTWTVTWLVWKLLGFNATVYHILNVVLHGICSALVLLVMRRLKVMGAFVGALLFAVHPVVVANVTWTSQLKSLLSSAFFLSSLLCYLSYAYAYASARPGKTLRYWLSLILFALALLSKSSAIPFPCILALLIWWKQGIAGVRNRLAGLLPFFILAVCQAFVEVWFQSNMSGTGPVRSISLGERLVLIGWNVSFYIEKAMLPINLSFIYPKFKINPASFTHWLPGIALVAAVAGLAVAAGKNKVARPVFVSLGSYLLMLVPVIGFADAYFFRYSTVADHYQYLALPALTALVSAGLFCNPRWRSVAALVATAILVVLTTLTWKQQQLYKDEVLLWKDAVSKNPESYLPHDVLGNLYYERGDREASLREFTLAVQLEPGDKDLTRNVAQSLISLKRFEDAKNILTNLVQQHPDDHVIASMLGDTYMALNQYDSALAEFRKAELQNPLSQKIGNRIAMVYMLMQKHSDAEQQLRRVLKRFPRSEEANRNLLKTYAAAGKTTEAVIVRNHMLSLGLNPETSGSQSAK